MPVAQTTSQIILVERRGGVARLVINRPPLNILDLTTLRGLRATLDAVFNDSDVRLVELSGAGEKVFSAGTNVRFNPRISTTNDPRIRSPGVAGGLAGRSIELLRGRKYAYLEAWCHGTGLRNQSDVEIHSAADLAEARGFRPHHPL